MERRRSKRLEVNVDVQVSVMDDTPGSVIQGTSADSKIERLSLSTEGAGQGFEAQMLDLSVNGARLASTTQPPLPSRVSLTFSFAEHVCVIATSLVIWRTTVPSPEGQYSFGVVFEAMPLDVRLSIQKAVTEQSP